MDSKSSSIPLHIAMYPWLALGHITPFLQISNKLASLGHRVSFFIPTKTVSKIQYLNRFPQLITFVPVTIPHVDGLPRGAETTADVAAQEITLVATAMDLTEPEVEKILARLKPDVVFFDFAHWVPTLARSLGFKTVYFSTASPVMMAYVLGDESNTLPVEKRLLEPPMGFPDPSIKLRRHEIPYFVEADSQTFGNYDMKLADRFRISVEECDAFASKGCREIEGSFVDFLEERRGWEISLTGPILPEHPASKVNPKWDGFLSSFEANSAVYCCLGSETRLTLGQFQELLLGLELSGRPFLAALKPPIGASTAEEALPKGFVGRVGDRGTVFSGWVPQQLILAHPAVGCFVTHCGYGSMIEGIVAEECQLVLLPNESDQFFNTKLVSTMLRAGVEVQRDENDGSFTREDVFRAVKAVMSEREIRTNMAELRELLLREGLESSYLDRFSQMLQALVAN